MVDTKRGRGRPATKKTQEKPQDSAPVKPKLIVNEPILKKHLKELGYPKLFDSEINDYLIKFGTKYNFSFSYSPKFIAFQCLQNGKHVDWITVNELLKRYDSTTQSIKGALRTPQRPAGNKRKKY